MLRNLFRSVSGPLPLLHVFIGVYPNDPATREAVEGLGARHPNVHLVLNDLPGPTSKGQNLNCMIRSILDFELGHRVRFAALLVHDAEDIIHPTSLKLANYLTHKYPVVQFPVFPLQHYPRFGTFFKFITSATYADEFAENHYTGLPRREASGAMVPSAGTGFVLSREVIDQVGSGKLFQEDSVTEDYRLSVNLAQAGIPTHFFIEGVQRVTGDGRVVTDYVATRELFPNTFREAVRQKSRWIYGIAFQSFSLLEVLRDRRLSGMAKYSLYKDWKTKFVNLLALPGYAVFTYTVASFIFDLPPIYPAHTVSWWLSVALTVMMLERQLMRATAINRVYGWRSAVAACLVPPLIPIRVVWGNVVNFFATVAAWRTAIFGFPKSRPRWQKTKHVSLPVHVLERSRRSLADLIVEKGYVKASSLAWLVRSTKKTKEPVSDALRRMGLASEEDQLQSRGETLGMQSLRLPIGRDVGKLPAATMAVFRRHNAVPIVMTDKFAIVAAHEPLEESVVDEMRASLGGRPITVVLSTRLDITRQTTVAEESPAETASYGPAERLVDDGAITTEWLVEALKHEGAFGRPLEEILREMGAVDVKDT